MVSRPRPASGLLVSDGRNTCAMAMMFGPGLTRVHVIQVSGPACCTVGRNLGDVHRVNCRRNDHGDRISSHVGRRKVMRVGCGRVSSEVAWKLPRWYSMPTSHVLLMHAICMIRASNRTSWRLAMAVPMSERRRGSETDPSPGPSVASFVIDRHSRAYRRRRVRSTTRAEWCSEDRLVATGGAD
jgi:hypothetical protein